MRYLVEISRHINKSASIRIFIIFWFTKNFYYQTHPMGLFLRYSYTLDDFHPNIRIEAVLIKKKHVVTLEMRNYSRRLAFVVFNFVRHTKRGK